MEWQGKILKEKVAHSGFTQEAFCEKIGVTRPAFTKWINDKAIPNGKYLIAICRALQISVDDLFLPPERLQPLYMPMHNHACTEPQHQAALRLAEEYKPLIVPENAPALVQSLTEAGNDPQKLGLTFRKLGEVPAAEPMQTDHILKLGAELGLCIILTRFPEELKKAYAFYLPINGVKVIFVDVQSDAFDLDFILLHEICHVVSGHDGNDPEQEDRFCNRVAENAMFPQAYLDEIAKELMQKKDDPEKIKFLCQKSKYCNPYCLFKALKNRCGLKWDYDHETLKTLFDDGDKLTPDVFCRNAKDARKYVLRYGMFSSVFTHCFLLPTLENMTDRYLAQVMNLDSVFDVAEVRKQLMTLRKKK